VTPRQQADLWKAIGTAVGTLAPVAGPAAPIVTGLVALTQLASDIASANMSVAVTIQRLRKLEPDIARVEQGWLRRIRERFGG